MERLATNQEQDNLRKIRFIRALNGKKENFMQIILFSGGSPYPDSKTGLCPTRALAAGQAL